MSQTTLTRYLLYQVPGWLIATAVGILLHRWAELSGWTIAILLFAWILKDAALFRFLRTSYEPDRGSVMDRLVGLSGVTVESLAPRGYIRVRGELWTAELVDADTKLQRERTVIIDAVRGKTLLVRPELSGSITAESPPS